MKIELKTEERDLILELLANELREIGPEIRHTDSHTYREGLKERQRLLHELTERLQAGQPVA